MAIAALVGANAVPLLGVLVFGWDLVTLVAIYWAENGVVGIYAVGRIVTAAGAGPAAMGPIGDGGTGLVPAPSTRYGRAAPPPPPWPSASASSTTPSPQAFAAIAAIAKFVMVPFFCIHYGMFWVVHGIFVWVALPAMFAAASHSVESGPDARVVLFAALVMLVSHGVSFVVNWILGGEYRTSTAAAEMGAPYARVVILHLTIIFGAFAVAFIGAPVAALVVMVLLKTGVDLAAHLGERARAAGRAERAGFAGP